MLRFKRRARLGLLLLGILVVLAGCFGGGLTPKPTPSPTPTPMHGQIFGPQGVQVASGAALDAAATLAKAPGSTAGWLFGARVEAATGTPLAGESALANVSILVYVLADYLNNPSVAPIAQTTTDANGKYSVSDIPVGKDLLIVTGSTPRLSAILLNVDKDTSGDVNSVTSLATEAWVETLRDDASMTINASSLQDTMDVAQNALLALDAAEWLAALTALIPAQLGDGWPSDLAPQWKAIANHIASSLPSGPPICQFELFESAGTPASFLTLSGIPFDWSDDDTFARFEVEGHEQSIPVYIELVGGGEAEFVVPLHPDDPMNGGTGYLVVYNEAAGIECQPIPITVDPLSPAPSNMGLSSLFDAMEQALTDYADVFGFSKSDLLDMNLKQANQANGLVAGLAASLQMLAGDGVTNNMRDVLDGSAMTVDGETYTFDPEDLMLVEAMAYTSGFSEALLTLLDEFSRLPAPPMDGAAGMGLMAMQPLQGGIIPPLPENITTPAELDYWMEVRTYCTMWNEDLLRAPREIVGGMASAASMVPGTQIVTGPLLAYLTVSQMFIDICSNMLPHKLTAFYVDAYPGIHNEDSDTEGTWLATMVASGEDWTLDWPTVIGAVPGLGGAGKVISKVAKQFGDNWKRAEPIIDWVQGMLFDVWSINSSSGPITLTPFNPAPIDIDPTRAEERDYIEWELITLEGDQPFVFNSDETGYIAQDIGKAQLWVRTRPGAFQGEFAGAHGILEVKAIEVEVVRPGWPESPYYVDPGEEIVLAAVVSNADDSTVEWEVTGGEFVREDGTLGDQLIRYTAPEEPGRYVVTAESMTRTGLRESGQPPRTGFAEIVVGGLRIIPKTACIEIGDSLPFRVVYNFGGDADISNLVVSVSGSAGYVDGNVFYGVSEGTAIVSVWDPDFPQWADEAVFTVRDACAGFSLSASGHENFSFEGMCMINFAGRLYFKDNAGNTVNISLPSSVLNDLEDGLSEMVVLDAFSAEIENVGTTTFGGWWTAGTDNPGTLTVWGEWVERDVYVPVIDETLTEEFFYLSGKMERTFMAFKIITNPDGNTGFDIVETHVVMEFRHITDGWARDGFYFEDVVCEDARPI